MNEELKREICYAIVDAMGESNIEGIGMCGHTWDWKPLFYYKGIEYKIDFEVSKKE